MEKQIFSVDGLLNLRGKTAVVIGLRNDRSIVWPIIQNLSGCGVNIVSSFRRDKDFEKRYNLLQQIPGRNNLLELDVTNEDHINSFIFKTKAIYGEIDFLVYAPAFAPLATFSKPLLEVTREELEETMNASAYSLITLAKKASELMVNGGSIITLSFLAAEKYLPNYTAMGLAKATLERIVVQLASELAEKNIRVNGISTGPIETLSSRAIKDFKVLIDHYEKTAPLGKCTKEDALGTAIFLLSDLGKAVTGEIIYADRGYRNVEIPINYKESISK